MECIIPALKHMFLKAASHPAVLREITEDLILSGWDTILLVIFAP